ncbi:origin recognition complex subunit 2 [Onthophagus taurus]|uniref:origin recognition complex subunit 2 n=1 Tax=Onthophagus taurus TaxID=166361 RepID=UPI0039BE8B0F
MEVNTPRRGQRQKRMSLKALEAQQVKNYEEIEPLREDPIFEVSSSNSEDYTSPSESSESSSSSDESNDEMEDSLDTNQELNLKEPKYLKQQKNSVKSVDFTQKKELKKKTSRSYMIKSEDYFFNNAIKKPQTSNHTLEHLKRPRLSQDELRKLLSNLTISEQHKFIIEKNCLDYKNVFKKWLCLLHEGFNVLTYGLGSKRDVLFEFQNDCLTDLPVIVVNGFFPSLTIKEILDSILLQILEIKESSSNLFEAVDLIEDEFKKYPNLHLYLIIHNIEGDSLRNPKHQGVLAKLVHVENIHLIASIDHINAPLIWDQNKLSKFNFTWWDLTSFLPYKDETSFETSMMITKTGSLALSSLKNVFLSLTSNSKGIYLIIVKYQLQNSGQYYQGMLFKDLYWSCREAFLVSSDLALRAQLTEFVDHKMVKIKRSVDGAEYLNIPIQNGLLQQFLNEQ